MMKATFRGIVLKKSYRIYANRELHTGAFLYKPQFIEDRTFDKMEPFYSYETSYLIFKAGEKVFITEKNLEVNIKQVMRTTDGDYIYDTDLVVMIKDDSPMQLEVKEQYDKLMQAYREYTRARSEESRERLRAMREVPKKRKGWFW